MAKTYKVRYRKTLPQRIQYPGSTIQQNFGEDLGKGYLLWDIKGPQNFDTEFHEVKNDYGFFTLRAEDGKLPDVELPPKCRIRVVWPIAERDISRTLVNELSQMVHDKYNPLSVRIDFKPTKDTRGQDLDLDTAIDVREINVQQDLLRKWMILHELPEDMQSEIIDIDKAIYDQVAKLEHEDFTQCVWKINSISIKDFMSYKGPESIDFRKLRGIIGLFGDNRSGKSVLIDAILYALFNKTTRDVKNHDLINKVTGAKKCAVQLSITIRGLEYQITRTTKMQFKKRTGEYSWTRTDLELKRVYDDGTIEDLTETQRNETEKIIRNAIGSFEDFLTTTLTTQSSQHEFIYQNASVRASNMARFLGLDVFNQKHDVAKEILREVDAARKVQDFEKKSNLLSSTREKSEELTATLKSKRKLNRELGVQLRKRNDLLDTLRDSINTINVLDLTRDELEAQIATLEAEITATLSSIAKLDEDAAELLQRGYAAEKLLAPEDDKTHALAGKLRDLDGALNDVRSAIQTEKEFIRALNEELSSNASCPVGDNDKTSGCVFLIRANEKHREILDRDARVADLESKIPSIEAKIEEARAAKQSIKDNAQIRSTIQELTSRIKDKKSAITELKGKIDLKRMSVTMLSDKLSLIDKNEKIVKQNRAVQLQIDEIRRQITKLQNQRDSVSDEITLTSGDLAVATARIEELEALIAEISTNDHKYELYNWYCKAMHRNGIPMTVLRKYIPVINYELNRILSPIVGFGVYFKIEDDSDNIEIVMRYDNAEDDTRPITMASGMEKFISNMSIRHVLLKISALNKPTLRIIDEGFDVLDNDNVYLVQKFFENVKADFDNIVLITHIDALKDCADHVVIVSQKAGVSRLRLN